MYPSPKLSERHGLNDSQVLFVILAACCMIGSTNGIGHSYADFTSLDIYKRALLVNQNSFHVVRYWLITIMLF
jgi:hypothetical protein